MSSYKRLAIAVVILCGCASMSPSVPEEKRAQLQSARSIVFVADIKDQVFGTRLSGLFMKATDNFQADWRSDQAVAETVTEEITSAGRKVYVVPMDQMRFQGTIEFDSIDDVFSRISRELSRMDPQSPADLHLILLHVPVDAVPNPIAGAKARMVGQGMIGLMWELGTDYKQSYVVRLNSALNAITWGKVQCIIVYALAAVDAHSHQVIQRFYPRWTDHPLPDDFWIADFQSLAPDKKTLLRESCLDALTTAVEEDLGKMGLR